MSVNLGDIQAIGDVLDEFANDIDSLDAAQAITMRNAVKELKRQTDLIIGLLQARVLNALEGNPIRVGDTVYTPKADGKWRPNHADLRAKVVERAIVNDDGERIDNPALAAGNAVRIMYELFVSPASVPKAGGLEKIRTELRDVASWERGVPTLREFKVGEEPDDTA